MTDCHIEMSGWCLIISWMSSWLLQLRSEYVFLQYYDAVGWVFWPIKPTTESENRLQLGSLSISVSIDRLTMVDNTSAVGNDSRPWVVPPVNKMAVNYHKGETDPSGFRVWLISSSLRDIFVPPYRQCLTDSSWQQQQQQQQEEVNRPKCRFIWNSQIHYNPTTWEVTLISG